MCALATRESLLNLKSGVLSTATGGGDILILADDVNFSSGEDKITGTGALTLQRRLY